MEKRSLIVLAVWAVALVHIIILDIGNTPEAHVKINENYKVKHKTIHTVLPQHELEAPFYPPFVGRSVNGFKEALGFKESRGNYFVVNSFGYLGKYQFGPSTLRTIGVHNTTSFLRSPEIQEKAFIANLERNKWILRKDIKKFSGKILNGVEVTESGILAAAHLGGPGNVKRYLRSKGARRFKDANGASIRYYMKKFSGYDLSHIVPNKAAKI